MRFLEPPPPPRRLLGPPARGRVLVLAPHPDDEAVGPGGVLLQHAALGDPIACVFLTSGAAGDATGREDPAAYAALRAEEARASARVLGIGALEFWGYPDGHEVNENDLALLVPRVRDAFERLRPDVVYAPHELDQHGDHHTAAVLLRRALAALAAPPPAFGYEVWSPCQADFVVDVSAVHERKMDALRCHASQLLHTDMVRSIGGLNAYRATFLEKGARFGEGYVPLAPDARAGRLVERAG